MADVADPGRVRDFLVELGQSPDNVIAFHQNAVAYMSDKGLTEADQAAIQDVDKLRELFGLRPDLPTCFVFMFAFVFSPYDDD